MIKNKFYISIINKYFNLHIVNFMLAAFRYTSNMSPTINWLNRMSPNSSKITQTKYICTILQIHNNMIFKIISFGPVIVRSVLSAILSGQLVAKLLSISLAIQKCEQSVRRVKPRHNVRQPLGQVHYISKTSSMTYPRVHCGGPRASNAREDVSAV